MNTAEIFDFSWPRSLDGYGLVKALPDRYSKRRLQWIQAIGERVEHYQPLKCAALYRHMARVVEGDPRMVNERALKFVTRFGLPHAPDASPGVSLKDFLFECRAAAHLVASADAQNWEGFLRLFEGWPASGHPASVLSPALRLSVAGKRPRLVVQPTDLVSAAWLQLALDVHGVGYDRVRSCAWCGDFFYFGSGTSHRSTAQYCTPRCQSAAAYDRRRHS